MDQTSRSDSGLELPAAAALALAAYLGYVVCTLVYQAIKVPRQQLHRLYGVQQADDRMSGPWQQDCHTHGCHSVGQTGAASPGGIDSSYLKRGKR
ncbi:hypothetical protein HaLaN_12407, partial [Haematococcus lacustris]